MLCLNCQEETSNPKFCSKHCSVSYNNRLHPRRKPSRRFCKYCGKELDIIRDSKGVAIRKSLCSDCNKPMDLSVTTKQDLSHLGKYQVSARIRENARKMYGLSSLPKKCFVCGYSAHVEVCHKKSIKSFDDTDSFSVINSLSNLIALCPNHHWEFDNGLLKFL